MQPSIRPTMTIAALTVLALSLSACNYPVATQLAPEEAIATAVRATTASRATAPPESSPPTAVVPTLPPATLTPTIPPPTSTTPPTSTPTATATPLPCNRAEFITDVTVPDGADYHPFDTFTKTWRLRNSGTCTWTSDYRVVFDHGDQMLAPDAAPITGGSVAPGATVDVSVPMEAPGTPGNYKGYWKLRDAGGVLFGVGASGNVAFWVEIESISALPAGPNFEVAFENLHTCGSLQYATFRLGNTGGVGFESIYLSIQDLSTSGMLYPGGSNNTPFLGTANECPPKNSSMGPGSVYFIAASIGASPPHGHNARLSLKMCTQDNQAGDCLTKTLDFVIP